MLYAWGIEKRKIVNDAADRDNFVRRTGSGLLIDIWKTKKRMLALINILSILFPQANSNTTFAIVLHTKRELSNLRSR